MRFWLLIAVVLVLATSAFGLEKRVYQLSEDYRSEVLQPPWCQLQYYYFIPCIFDSVPPVSYFWGFSGWQPGEVIAGSYRIGDQAMDNCAPCDPALCHELGQIRVIDFAGYGISYPGLFDICIDVWCGDTSLNPFSYIGGTGPVHTGYGYNWFSFDPPLCLTPCCEYDLVNPTIIITMTFCGTDGGYPAVGFDNISSPLLDGCEMHDRSCLPALYPRDWFGGTDPKVHSGLVGDYLWENWPPLGILDGRGPEYGYVEAAWWLDIRCAGPTANGPSTWGSIKSMYR